MRRFFASALVLGLFSVIGLVGCGEEGAGPIGEPAPPAPGGELAPPPDQPPGTDPFADPIGGAPTDPFGDAP